MYNDRCIILNEIVDKEKLEYILDNNDFDQEVNILAKNYHDSLDDFGRKRVSVKRMFLTILNGGFKDLYSEDTRINNYLKLLEKEVIKIQEYFYSKDKRYFEKGYNYMGKNLSIIILDIENQILQVMINYFVLKRVNIGI